MNLIDVTLRDGGHAVKFNWSMSFAQEYYNLICKIEDIKYIELGYWKQTSKSENPFYNLNQEKINEVTGIKGLKNVSVMIDYHYCSHTVEDYPKRSEQDEISMIRLCSRKEDIQEAIEFGKQLKEYTDLKLSLNIFNTSNYTEEELLTVCCMVEKYPFDFVYFADTHGSLDFEKDFDKFEKGFNVLRNVNKSVGMHLHEHSGKAIYNFKYLLNKNIDSSDTSIRGIGKGAGNLRLEFVVNKKHLVDIAEFIRKHDNLLTVKSTTYELITAMYSLTDNYAKEARERDLTIYEFDNFCKTLKGLDRDSYDKNLLKKYLKR